MIGIQIVSEGNTIDGVKVLKIHAGKVKPGKNGKRWAQGLNEIPGREW